MKLTLGRRQVGLEIVQGSTPSNCFSRMKKLQLELQVQARENNSQSVEEHRSILPIIT